MNRRALLKSFILGLLLSAAACACAALPVRLAGDAASALGLEDQIVTMLSQLKKAEIVLPWWILAPGTLLLMLPLYRMCVTRHFIVGFLCLIPLILFLLVIWIGSMATMYVNKVPIFTLLRILYNWVMSGAL